MPAVRTSAGNVFYDECGAGSPVVLLHATLHDHHDFDQVAPGLAAAGYRAIALDWPGHGDSTLQPPNRRLDSVAVADSLSEFVDQLHLPPAVFVGNSVGGFAAARLAIEQPQRVAGLVLVNTGGFGARTVGSLLGSRLLGTPAISRRLIPALAPRYMHPTADLDRAITRRVQDLARTPAGARLAAGLWRSFGEQSYDLRAHASRITAPTMLVWGTRDVLLPLRAAREAHQALPAADLHLFDTGHVVFASDPTGFLAIVEPFIEAALMQPNASAS